MLGGVDECQGQRLRQEYSLMAGAQWTGIQLSAFAKLTRGTSRERDLR